MSPRRSSQLANGNRASKTRLDPSKSLFGPGDTRPLDCLEFALRRPPSSLLVLTLFAALLGGWMTFGGLYLRFFNQINPIQTLIAFWIRILSVPNASANLPLYKIEVQDFAWPLLAIGLAWSGALSALWLKLRWGYSITTFLGVFSLLSLGWGTILALLVLICLRMPSTQRWLNIVEEPDATRMGTSSVYR